MDDLTQALPNLGSTAAIIWLLIHIFRVLLPDLITRFAVELQKQRSEYLDALSEFRVELNKQREALERLTEAVETLCQQVKQSDAK